MTARVGERGSSFRTIARLMAIPLAGLAIFFLWNWLNGGQTPREALRVRKAPAPAAARHDEPPAPAVAAASTVAPLPRVKPRRRGEIVLIIDDLGFEGQPLDRLTDLDPNLNCSILPNGTRTRQFAEALHARGFEILCHLPMEPRGNERPGRGAILTSMTNDEIAQLTREDIAAVPHARGVNNHMGSRATTDRRVMQSAIGAFPAGMYFIDSRTTGGSVAGDVARRLGVPTASRDVFLDDTLTPAAIRRQLAELVSLAERHGLAVGIGHPHPTTIRVLEEELPLLRERGLHLVRASAVVR